MSHNFSSRGTGGVTCSNILNIHFCAFCKRSYSSTVTFEGGRSREGRRCENDCDSNRALSQLVVVNAAEDAAIRSCTVLRKNRTWSVFFGERYERYDDDERYDEEGFSIINYRCETREKALGRGRQSSFPNIQERATQGLPSESSRSEARGRGRSRRRDDGGRLDEHHRGR